MARPDRIVVFRENEVALWDESGVVRRKRDWRWHRLAPNGEIVGASSEGYRNRKECEANARRAMTPCEIS